MSDHIGSRRDHFWDIVKGKDKLHYLRMSKLKDLYEVVSESSGIYNFQDEEEFKGKTKRNPEQ